MSRSGPQQWRSLEQLADTPAFRRFMEREFPAVTDLCTGPERRRFLKLMAASLTLAGLAGCDDPADGRGQEVPFVQKPLRAEPGAVLTFASVAMLDGIANGVLVTTRDGRPLKIEGNPQHPWSRGGTDIFAQASVLDLYDPARSETVRHLGQASSVDALRAATRGRFGALRDGHGEGLRLLTGPVTSPSLQAQIAAIRQAFPAMQWHSYSPVDRTPLYQAAARAFGRPVETRWRFDRARVVVALDGDFLDAGPQQTGVSRDWAAARQASAAAGALLPLYAAGPLPTLTSAKADFPLVASPAELEALTGRLLAAASGGVKAGDAGAGGGTALDRWCAAAIAALQAHRGAGLVIAGSTAPVAVQEAAHRINAGFGNTGGPVFYTAPVVADAESLGNLVAAMGGGQVSALVTLGVNPVYDAPGGLHFADALARVGLKIHAGLYEDETALHCDWHLPMAHPLESWGDARSLDGTAGVHQPTIAPLYGGRTAGEILSLLTEPQAKSGRDLLEAYWHGRQDAGSWEETLRNGFVAGSAFPAEDVHLVAAGQAAGGSPTAGLTALVRPDPTVWDGSRADNGWLQELPKPLTKITWDNAICVSPALAARESLHTGDVVRVTSADGAVEGAVWVLPGQADGTVGLTLGYGHSVIDRLSTGAGYAAAPLLGGDAWQVAGVRLEKTGRSAAFATTQDHNSMEGHAFVRVQQEGAAPVGETVSWTQPTLYDPPRTGDGTAWGMVIDLDACTGCNACVVACQAENNIAVVGKEQVALGREMHWLRVDRYYEGPPEAPVTRFQPVPCMHCENAPCEVGCPVEATLHDTEGLNLMVYNRCVGTRACSGYCPYKVRHFNYLDYAAGAAPQLELQRNPQVTVRARGVMEKCTYCVQRIETARIAADLRNGEIATDTVKTACQAACPTEAITFGNLLDKDSAVAAARAEPRNYALLGELNVRPRTTYLAARAPRAI